MPRTHCHVCAQPNGGAYFCHPGSYLNVCTICHSLWTAHLGIIDQPVPTTGRSDPDIYSEGSSESSESSSDSASEDSNTFSGYSSHSSQDGSPPPGCRKPSGYSCHPPDPVTDSASLLIVTIMSDQGDNIAMDDIKKSLSTIDPHSSSFDKGAALRHAKEKGWTEPVPYNYSTTGVQDAAEDAFSHPEAAWLSDAVRYEWSDDYGEVGPANSDLEQKLFYSDKLVKAGALIKAYEFEVTLEGPIHINPVRDFDDAGLHPLMRENVRLCRYETPTPIQAYCIPSILLGHDIVACAQTGSGKTAAYLIPVLSKLMGKARQVAANRPNPLTYNAITDRVRAEPLVLIVCPTRELACQIFDEARRLCYRTMLRPCVVYGGAPSRNQREELEKGCDVLIATPGRLCDFMNKTNLLSLARLKFTIIDEADEMLQDDWEETMSKIFGGGDANEDADHMYLMFSATFPKAARELARQYMAQDYVRIRVGRVGSTHGNIKQRIIWTEDSEKKKALYDLIFSMSPARTLVFVNNKREADFVDDFLYNAGLPSTSIHADRTQREREDALRSFKIATCPILVATGVTARGLDINNVMHVINFDLPSGQHGGIDEYVHRIGRTARIGNQGFATSFYNSRNEDIADDLVKILVESKQEIPDFLEDRVPETVTWDDDTDNEDSNADEENVPDAANGGYTFTAANEADGFSADAETAGNW